MREAIALRNTWLPNRWCKAIRQVLRLEGQLHDLNQIKGTAPDFDELVALADGFPYPSKDDNRDVLRAFTKSIQIDFPTRAVVIRWKLDPNPLVIHIPGLKGRGSKMSQDEMREWLLELVFA